MESVVTEIKKAINESDKACLRNSLSDYEEVKELYDRLVSLINEFQAICTKNGISFNNAKKLCDYPVYIRAINSANELEKQIEYLQSLKLYVEKR